MPKTAQKLFDQSLRRQIHVNRFTKKLGRDSLKLLNKAQKDIVARLASGQLTEFGRKRFENMLDAIRNINSNVYAEIGKGVAKELRKLTKDELRFHTKSLQNAFSIKMKFNRPTTEQVFASAIATPFEGFVLKEWVKKLDTSAVSRIESVIKMGFVEGQTIDQMTRSLKGVYKTDRRGLEALVRTATTHIGSVSRENLYKANDDVIKGVRWVSTLDGRTTPICQRRDGRVYEVESGPRPPAHFGCRSVTVPVTKSWKELGFDDLDEDEQLSKRPFVADKRKLKDIPKSQRNIGLTSSDETYPKWLKRQNAGFQDDVLGKTRGKLFREGKVTLKKFSDTTGTLYTLDQLRNRENLALEDIQIQ